MNLNETIVSSNCIYKGKIINVCVDEVQLPDGCNAKREVVKHNGGVCVAAITDNDEVYLVRQFRYPYRQVIYEIPAGKRDGDEEPLECAKRELKEETGCTADNFVPLGQLYPSPGYCDEIIWMYAAKGLNAGENKLDEGEFLESFKMPLETVIEMVMSGEIKDAKTQTAILKVAELRRQGKF